MHASNLNSVVQLETLTQAQQLVHGVLKDAALHPHQLTQVLRQAFGSSWDQRQVEHLIEQWSGGSFEMLPLVKILPQSKLGEANGAFAASTNTIYLSNRLLHRADQTDDLTGVVGVLLEETGHWVDSLINSVDSDGDEGEIFSRTVQDATLNKSQLAVLKAETDTGVIALNTNSLAVEFSSPLEASRNQNGKLELFTIGSDGRIKQKWQDTVNGGWANWGDFGLNATEFELAQNADGRLEMFAIGTDGKVWQRWQFAPNGTTGWSNWGETGLRATDIEVVRNADGRLEIFGVATDGKVWTQWQKAPNGTTGWSGWGEIASGIKEVEVGQNADGRLEMFATGTDGKVWQRWQFAPNGTTGWSGWGEIASGIKEVEVGQNADGRLEMFATGTDGKVWQRWQFAPNGTTGWSGWGEIASGIKEVEVARNADGHLDLFAVGIDGNVWQQWQKVPNGITGWSGWGQFASGIREFETIQNADGRLEVFAIEVSGRVLQRWQFAPNGTTGWSNWGEFGLNVGITPTPTPTPIPIPSSPLASLSAADWDRASGDDLFFDGRGNDESRREIQQIYTDLSATIFGSRKGMTAGYAFDPSYARYARSPEARKLYPGIKPHHAGIDIGVRNGTSIKAATNGIVAKVSMKSYGGVVGIDEINSKGEKTGRRWWYVHNTSNSVRVGNRVTAGRTEIGKVGRGHLHLAVTDSSRPSDPANGNRPEDVTSQSMSPLHAFWESKIHRG